MKKKPINMKELKAHVFWEDACQGSELTLHLNTGEQDELNKLVATVESFSTPPTYNVRLYKWNGYVELNEKELSILDAQKIFVYWIVLYKKTATLEYRKNPIVELIDYHPFWQDTCKGSNLTLYLNIPPAKTSGSYKLVATVESFLMPPTYNLYRNAQDREMTEENLQKENVKDVFLNWYIRFEKTATLEYEKHEVCDFARIISGESRVQPRIVKFPSAIKLPILSGIFRTSRDTSPRSPKSSITPRSSRSSSRNSSTGSMVSSADTSPRPLDDFSPRSPECTKKTSSGESLPSARSPLTFRRSTSSLPTARTASLRAQVLNEMLTKK